MWRTCGIRKSLVYSGPQSDAVVHFLRFRAGLVWRPVVNPYIVYTAICSTYTILLLRLCLSATCRFPYKLVQWPMLPLAAAAAFLRLGSLTPDQEFYILMVSLVIPQEWLLGAWSFTCKAWWTRGVKTSLEPLAVMYLVALRLCVFSTASTSPILCSR